MAKNKRFADDGWAIWVSGDDTSTIYLNEWVNPLGKSYVDFGIRISGVQATHEMFIYVPFRIEASEIEDLSHRMREQKVFRAVLNASGLIDYMRNRCTSELAYHGRTVDLVHLSELEFSCEPLSDGTMIVISIDAIKPYLENDEASFMFRLPHKSLDKIFAKQVNMKKTLTRLRDLVTSPVVAEHYGYSVRINEARLLPMEINQIGAFHRQKLRKATVTISLNEQYQINDSTCYRVRRLEEDLYQGYTPESFDCSDVISYQWEESRETNLRGHFNFYFDISRESISRGSMIAYVLLLFLVGVVGEAIWSLLELLFS